MNALQISPLGATAPPASSGKDKAPSGAPFSPAPKAQPQPELAVPEATADQQVAEARAHFASAAEERKAKTERARAEEAAVRVDIGTLERQVGTVEGTNKVFVDLVDPILKQSVVRVFGPTDKEAAPAEQAPQPARPGSANAYTVAGASLPLKDLGTA